MAPAVGRTSLASAAGSWKCIPLKVPLRELKETLHCATAGSSPCSANSRAQKARAKNPRSSRRSSRPIRKAPGSGVGVKRMSLPEEFVVDLAGLDEVFQLLQ